MLLFAASGTEKNSFVARTFQHARESVPHNNDAGEVVSFFGHCARKSAYKIWAKSDTALRTDYMSARADPRTDYLIVFWLYQSDHIKRAYKLVPKIHYGGFSRIRQSEAILKNKCSP